MPSPEHEAYQHLLGSALRELAHDPDRQRTILQLAPTILVLYFLDLTPALPYLTQGYATSSRGGDSWSPLPMLRALLLSHLVDYHKFKTLSNKLRGCPVLRALAGFTEEEMASHDQPAPGASTFYDFLHRLMDGPQRKVCEHNLPPSQQQTRRARSLQTRKGRPASSNKQTTDTQEQTPGASQATDKKQTPSAQKTAAQKTGDRPKKQPGERAAKARMQRRKDWRDQQRQRTADGVTAKLVEQLVNGRDAKNPNDMNERLGHILLHCALLESARRGLLGDLKALRITGDGSPLRTAANSNGVRVCDCPRLKRCDCPRRYSDPDAAWGWDHYRETYYFGYSLYEISVTSEGRDLPLAIQLNPANETDQTASVKAMERLMKRLRDHCPSWAVDVTVNDAGHDSLAMHRFCRSWKLRPVIPLARAAPASHPSRGEMKLSENGIPLCQAGVEMTSWGSAGSGAAKRPLFLCPVGAGKLERCPLAPPEDPKHSCRPDLKRGPAVTVSPEDDLRLFPEISRNSDQYKALYKLRSGTERSNSLKKGAYALPGCRHRRASIIEIRLHLAAMLQHAKAWVAGMNAKEFVLELLGETVEVAAK